MSRVHPKPCATPGCPEPVLRRPKESSVSFRTRAYCCLACKMAHRAGQVLNSKPCAAPGCRNTVVRPIGLSTSEWAAREYCSGVCANRGRSAQAMRRLAETTAGIVYSPGPPPTVTKPCRQCRRMFGPREGMKTSHFAKAIRCDACNAARRQDAEAEKLEVAARRTAKAAAASRTRGPARPRRDRPSRAKGLAAWGLPARAGVMVAQSGDVARAETILRRLGPVYPAGVVDHPYVVAGRNSGVWIVGGERVTEAQMVAMAALLERALAA